MRLRLVPKPHEPSAPPPCAVEWLTWRKSAPSRTRVVRCQLWTQARELGAVALGCGIDDVEAVRRDLQREARA